MALASGRRARRRRPARRRPRHLHLHSILTPRLHFMCFVVTFVFLPLALWVSQNSIVGLLGFFFHRMMGNDLYTIYSKGWASRRIMAQLYRLVIFVFVCRVDLGVVLFLGEIGYESQDNLEEEGDAPYDGKALDGLAVVRIS